MTPRIFTTIVLLLFFAGCGQRVLEPDEAIVCDRCEGWNMPQDPFRIHGNSWYVGTAELSSILIESDDGLILIDGGLPQSATLIDRNIRNLGFDPRNVKAILVSHAHYDHVGGISALQRLSGAEVFASQAALGPLTTGRLATNDPQYSADSDEGNFPPLRDVTAVGDGGVVTVGSLQLTAVYTPGHTPGGTTWTWQSCALNTCYDIVYADSMSAVSAEGFSFADSGAAEDLVASAGRIGDLACDILLTPHPFFFGLHDKLERLDQGNPFINRFGCILYAETSLGWLEQRLQAERSH